MSLPGSAETGHAVSSTAEREQIRHELGRINHRIAAEVHEGNLARELQAVELNIHIKQQEIKVRSQPIYTYST